MVKFTERAEGDGGQAGGGLHGGRPNTSADGYVVGEAAHADFGVEEGAGGARSTHGEVETNALVVVGLARRLVRVRHQVIHHVIIARNRLKYFVRVANLLCGSYG